MHVLNLFQSKNKNMIRKNARWIILSLMGLFIGTLLLPFICKQDSGNSNSAASNVVPQKPLPNLDIPKFDPNSAYDFTDKIIAIGPRVVGSPGAQKVRAYIIEQFKKFGAIVTEQPFTANIYDGKKLPAVNIIARTNLQATKRIFLSAHWDSRPFADDDKDISKKKLPVAGADDSGSAIGTLLEIARQLQLKPLADIGVDFILFDAEDYGDASKTNGPFSPEQSYALEHSWGLGAQYWASHLHVPGYAPIYGVNLDMIGARSAHFPKEGQSLKYAPAVVEKIWRVGRYSGYTNYFSEEVGQGITDDHKFVNEIAHLPTVDIVNLNTETTFGEYHHTAHDTMDILDKETMKAVGQTLLSVLHYEQANAF